jgi:hypothetical protein
MAVLQPESRPTNQESIFTLALSEEISQMTLFRRTARMTFGLVCISGLVGFGSAEAASIIAPSSYSYTSGTTAGDPGVPLFDDPDFTKLTDGSTGTLAPSDGSWVAWNTPDGGTAEITFNFASSVTITDVSIDFLRRDASGVELPPQIQIATTVFPVANFSTDPAKGFEDFTGSWTGSQLVVKLPFNNVNFLLINEVTFNGTTTGTTPEPGTVALALTGLVAVVGWGRGRNYFTR